MKKVIYTCISGCYDPLRQPLAIDPSWDYVCFTDDMPPGKEGVWQIRPIPFDGEGSLVRSRYPKLLPHKVLPEYDYSFFMDANVIIKGRELYSFLDRRIEEGCLAAQVQHPLRDCVYADMAECHVRQKISLPELVKQRKKLKSAGFPTHAGLYENNLLLRRHNDPAIVRISERWWASFSESAKRDQFSLVPIYLSEGFAPSLLFGEGLNARNVPFLEYVQHPAPRRTFLQKFHRRAHVFAARLVIRIFGLGY